MLATQNPRLLRAKWSRNFTEGPAPPCWHWHPVEQSVSARPALHFQLTLSTFLGTPARYSVGTFTYISSSVSSIKVFLKRNRLFWEGSLS